MECPIDGAKLLMTDRQGVEIDYCPDCRGVWLDRGELDKLLQRDTDRGTDRDRDQGRSRDDDDDDRGHSSGYPKKKKKGWLSEVFEFGD